MSREDRIFSKLEFIEYVYQKYPNILTEWKNKNAGVDETPADDTMEITSPRDQLRHEYRDK